MKFFIGEFSNELDDPEEALRKLLKERPELPGHIVAVFVQNSIKLFLCLLEKFIVSEDLNAIQNIVSLMDQKMTYFVSSGDIEVQERASSTKVIVELIKSICGGEVTTSSKTNQDLLNDVGDENESQITTTSLPNGLAEMVKELKLHFEGDLMPVAPKAQRKVPIPDDLNLDEWIIGPPSDSESDDEISDGKDGLFVAASEKNSEKGSRRDSFEPTTEELEKVNKLYKLFHEFL
jgi:AP-3 complex subunit delta